MKKAIILFNLGGPDKLENVEPFLFNMFNDPAILNLPSFFRFPLAKLISKRRAPTAKKIYQELGGSSPILKLTVELANALEKKLNNEQGLSKKSIGREKFEKATGEKSGFNTVFWQPKHSIKLFVDAYLISNLNSLSSFLRSISFLCESKLSRAGGFEIFEISLSSLISFIGVI